MVKCNELERKIAKANGISPYDFAIEKRAKTNKYHRMMENAIDCAIHNDGIIDSYNTKPWYVENESERRKREAKETKSKMRQTICPKCGSKLKNCNGPYGSFVGCSSFPNCNYSRRRW